MNNIPKEKTHYNNTMLNNAKIDNQLAAAQLAIGESSNLAQICLTYTYNFPDKKYVDYVCILSVLAQVAIDSAKRRFDIDINHEIDRIKKDMDINKNGYPIFWTIIRPGFNRKQINTALRCPMNYMYDLKPMKFCSDTSTLPVEKFLVKYDLPSKDYRRSRKVEDMIQRYSINLRDFFMDNIYDNEHYEEYWMLKDDFKKMIEDIKDLYISNNYICLMSWLINRSFRATAGIRRNEKTINNTLNKNRVILLKTLYKINPKLLLKCFSGNIQE